MGIPHAAIRALAIGATVLAVASLELLGLSGGDTGQATTEAWAQCAFAVGGCISLWLGYIWRRQGHYRHGTIALVAGLLAQLTAIAIVAL